MGDSYTIQISSKLVDRLAYDENKVKKRSKKSRPRALPETEHVSETKAAANSSETAAPTKGWPLQPPVFLPVIPKPAPAMNPELEAIRSVLQESEKVVERLQKQEDSMVEELTQRAKELRDKEFKLPYQKPIHCLDEKSACQKCYEEHIKDPLKCADLVRRYADCAREARRHATATNK